MFKRIVEKGQRKVSVNRESACFLVIGLVLILIACGHWHMDLASGGAVFIAYCGGIVGKDAAFNFGNAKEHQANADAAQKVEKS